MRQREGKIVDYTFDVHGAGGDGSLEIESRSKEKCINFDIVKVNFNKKEYATLHNFSKLLLPLPSPRGLLERLSSYIPIY